MNIVVTGSVAYDYIMSFPGQFKEHILPDQLDHLSVSFLVDEMRKQRGGCAANIAYNLTLLGEHPKLMATVGQDFGDYHHWLDEQGVDTSGLVVIPDVNTASFFVITDLDSNQVAGFYTGAMARARDLSFHDMDRSSIDLVVISPNDPRAMLRYPAECRELGLPFLYDPSQQIIRFSGDELAAGLSGAKVLIVNEYEFGMLRNKTGLDARRILESGTEAVITTLGKDGSRIETLDGEFEIAVIEVDQALDPTGVGDAYRAGLCKGLAMGVGWEIAGKMGTVCAAYVIECNGPQSHCYTPAEFVERFRQHFDDGGALDPLEALGRAADNGEG
jgi:adenosine kinase